MTQHSNIDLNEQQWTLLNEIFERTDLALADYKPTTVVRRVRHRMAICSIAVFDDYLGLLREDAAEREALAKDLCIAVTRFFRDPEVFDALKPFVERLVAEHEDDTPLRVWVPGCATGEEAYSLAIVFLEAARRANIAPNLILFATDLDPDSVHIARKGIYPAGIQDELPAELLDRYFHRRNGAFVVSDALRENLAFAVQDIVNDPPFPHLDLISCRNVLIYLRREAQDRVFHRLQFALRPRGLLLLGRAESPEAAGQTFRVLDAGAHIYQRVGSAGPARESRSFVPTRITPVGLQARPRSDQVDVADGPAALLEAFVPPSIIVSADDEVIYAHGGVGRFLEIASGPSSTDLEHMLPPELRAPVVAAIVRSRRQGGKTATRHELSDGRTILLEAQPLPGLQRDAVCVSFIVGSAQEAGTSAAPNDADELVSQIQAELRSTRRELRDVVQDLESSNEELLASNEESTAINEELQAANEELEASAQEIQAVNEDLRSANEELHTKFESLQRAQNDIANLITSSQLATLFLDRELRIQFATMPARALLGLDASSIGRELAEIELDFDKKLVEDVERVQSTHVPIARELRHPNGTAWERRLHPYLSDDGSAEGVVITFVDVSKIRSAFDELEHRARQQRETAQLGLAALATTTLPQFLTTTAQRVSEVLDVPFVKIVEHSPEHNELILRAGVGWREGSVGEITIKGESESMAGYALSQGDVVFVDMLEHETRFTDSDMLASHGIVSGLACPIIEGPHQYGVLSVHTSTHRVFTAQEADFLRSIATIVAHALSRARVRLRHELEGLITRFAGQPFRAEDVHLGVATTLAEFLGIDICELWMVAPDSATMTRRVDWTSIDDPSSELAQFGAEFDQAKPDEGFVGRTWAVGRGIWVDNLLAYDEFVRGRQAKMAELQSGFSFPLKSGEEVLGVVCCFSTKRLAPDLALLGELDAFGRTLGETLRRFEFEREARRRGAINAAVLDASLDAILLTDQYGEILEFNPAAEALFGRAREDVRGQPVEMIITPERFREAHRNGMARFRETGRRKVIGERLEMPALRSDGEEFPVELVISPVMTDDALFFAGFLRDLTPSRLADNALRESEKRFRAVFEGAAVGAALVDLDGRWARANHVVEQITGYSEDQLRGMTFADVTHPDDVPDDLASIERLLSGEVTEFQREKRYVRPDRTVIWTAVSVSALLDEEGQPQQFIVFIKNISAERQAREALHEANRQKDIFLAMLGHELRNPLSATRNAVELIGLAETRDSRINRAHQVLERQTRQMSRLLDGLLDVSRIVLGKVALDLAPLDLGRLVEETVRGSRYQFDEREVEITVAVDEPIWVAGDEARLVQIVDNLLSNAAKFSPANGHVNVELRADGDSAVLIVTDDGPGIDSSLLPHIFEPFRQADQDLARASGGLGLGLAVVRGLVELHGGSVTAASEPERGTRFEVRLPTVAAPVRREASPDLPSGSLDVLVIEDNVDAAELFAELITALGHEVRVAHDGTEGLRLADERKPDLLFCDIGLPGDLSGHDVAKRFRATDKLASVTLVALTGYGRPDDRARGAEAGFDQFLTKPIDLATIRAVLAAESE